MAMLSSLDQSGVVLRENVRPHARDFCATSIVITLLVASLIGVICGVIAYHVASGQAMIHAFSKITLENSYVMMGGFSFLFIVSSIALAYFVRKS